MNHQDDKCSQQAIGTTSVSNEPSERQVFSMNHQDNMCSQQAIGTTSVSNEPSGRQ
ncbi:hypothetical protein ACJMK2_043805, partial [Sinanodonta woodiana]